MGEAAVVTAGVFSGMYEPWSHDRQDDAVLTDAAMAPGSSGGALVDQYGSLVGINDIANVAFGVHRAVPVNRVKSLLALH
jgi:S1-C subfamily serine protease